MSEELPSSHKGKIGSFPADIREEVNQSLHNGVIASAICEWLNEEPRVLKILDERWNEQPVSPQNISEWKKGGYKIWQRQREKSNHLKVLTNWAATVADKVPVEKLTGAAQRIMAGNLLEAMEGMESGQALALIDALGGVTLSIDRSKKNEIALLRAKVAEKQAETRSEQLELDRDRFETVTVEKFLKWQGTDEAQNILDSGKPKHVQADQLRELFFGPLHEEGKDE